ncbi:hypothetical protein FYK55_03695 [Roseiconus nitratireducens]|uniref:DUF4177 domain-containing protein n=1 Tax=Roseiconus nitratireducens TaxID=2605748 RepID=A0A5M6DEP1_9BACT|nr:zf-TFIIB domain-containing protein [Roseiconus nitratireducens]KAA5546021.1 hypothetical protein FYK55_03695 [Roseiconus nitratireducens]
MKYQIIKSVTGRSIKYSCPKCHTVLRSALREAGQSDACPSCGNAFIVPGQKERAEFEAIREAKRREKLEAKERERARRQQESLQAAAEKDAENQRIEMAKRERSMREARAAQSLAGSCFDIAMHDWSTGAPWAYECIELGTLSGNWQSEMKVLLNNMASKGWEFYRTESLTAERPNGCLAALFGSPTSTYEVAVLVFRRPASVITREIDVKSELGLV